MATISHWDTLAIPRWEHSPQPLSLAQFLQQEPSPFRVTTRDLDMLVGLAEHRILSPMHMARMYFASHANRSYMQRRLTQLWQVGLVMRMRPAVGPREGSAPYLYTLSNVGMSLLRRVQPDLNPAIFYREDAQGVSLNLIRHEVALNDLCLDILDGVEDREGAAEWIPTKLTRQSFVTAGQTILMEPDAVIRGQVSGMRGERLVHIELELSADVTRFRQKLRRWTAYRTAKAWQEFYSRAPRILVVGYTQAAPVPSGRKRRIINSIQPLQGIARSQHFTNIAFLSVEERADGGWQCLPDQPGQPGQSLWDFWMS